MNFSDKKLLLQNVSVLMEEVSESSPAFDSGRHLLSQLIRKFLAKNISPTLEFLVTNDTEMSKLALQVLSRVKIGADIDHSVSHLLLIETLTGRGRILK